MRFSSNHHYQMVLFLFLSSLLPPRGRTLHHQARPHSGLPFCTRACSTSSCSLDSGSRYGRCSLPASFLCPSFLFRKSKKNKLILNIILIQLVKFICLPVLRIIPPPLPPPIPPPPFITNVSPPFSPADASSRRHANRMQTPAKTNTEVVFICVCVWAWQLLWLTEKKVWAVYRLYTLFLFVFLFVRKLRKKAVLCLLSFWCNSFIVFFFFFFFRQAELMCWMGSVNNDHPKNCCICW